MGRCTREGGELGLGAGSHRRCRRGCSGCGGGSGGGGGDGEEEAEAGAEAEAEAEVGAKAGAVLPGSVLPGSKHSISTRRSSQEEAQEA